MHAFNCTVRACLCQRLVSLLLLPYRYVLMASKAINTARGTYACIALHACIVARLRLSHAGRRTYIQYSSVVLGDSSLGWWKQECVLNQLSALTRRESAFSSTATCDQGKITGSGKGGRERNPSKLAHARHTERRQIKGEGSSEGRHSPIGSARPPSPSVRPVCQPYTTSRLLSIPFPVPHRSQPEDPTAGRGRWIINPPSLGRLLRSSSSTHESRMPGRPYLYLAFLLAPIGLSELARSLLPHCCHACTYVFLPSGSASTLPRSLYTVHIHAYARQVRWTGGGLFYYYFN